MGEFYDFFGFFRVIRRIREIRVKACHFKLAITKDFSNDIGSIFITKTADWTSIDAKCEKYSIGILVINDIDPLWDDLPALKKDRLPLYENTYYAVYSCGNYSALTNSR